MDTKVFRSRYGLSQRQFAEFFGVPIRTVHNWDYRNCAPEYFICLCHAYMELYLKDGGVINDKKTDSC